MSTTTMRGYVRSAVGAAVVAASFALPGAAFADKTTCPSGQATQVEPKTCPNGAVVQRACCTKTTEKGTKTRCKSFPKCPKPTQS